MNSQQMNSKTMIEKKERKSIKWWYPTSFIMVVLVLSSLIATMIILNRKVKRETSKIKQESSNEQNVTIEQNFKEILISDRKESADVDSIDVVAREEIETSSHFNSIIKKDIVPSDPSKIPSSNDVDYWRKIMARNARLAYVFMGASNSFLISQTVQTFYWGSSMSKSLLSSVIGQTILNGSNNSAETQSTSAMESAAFEQSSNALLTKTFAINVIFCNQRSIGLRSTSAAGELTYKRSLESILYRFGIKTEIKATAVPVGSRTGTWTSATAGVAVLNSTTQNSSLTFTFTEPSTTIIVVLVMTGAATGSTFNILVDGVLNTTGSNTSSTGVNSTFSFYSIRLSNLTDANHVIQVVKTGTTGTLHVFSCYTHNAGRSPIYLFKEYYALPAGYATFTQPPTNADVDRYNGYLDQVVASLPLDVQNNISVIDTNTRWNPAIHLSTNSLSPNDFGLSLICDLLFDKMAEKEIRPGTHIVRSNYTGLVPSLTTDQDYWIEKSRRNHKNYMLWQNCHYRSYGHEFNNFDAKNFSTISFTQYINLSSRFAFKYGSSAQNYTMEDSAMNINGREWGIPSQGFLGVITLMSNQYNVCTKSHLPLAPLSFKKSLEFIIARCASRETTAASLSPKRSGTWTTVNFSGAGGMTNTYQFSTVEGSSIQFDFMMPSTVMAVTLFGTLEDTGSTYDIFVDGELKSSGNTSSQSILGNRPEWLSSPGAPNVVLMRNLPMKNHSVKVVKTGSTGTLHVDSAFIYNADEAPFLVILKDTYCAPSGYARFTTSYPTDATVDEYNSYIDQVVALFPERNNNITVLNPNGSGWDPQIHILSDRDDGQHPNDLGARFLGELVLDTIATRNIEKGTHYIK